MAVLLLTESGQAIVPSVAFAAVIEWNLSLYVHCWLVLGFNWCSSLFQILLDSRDGVIFVEQVFRGIDFCLCV
jgi:hypothetical protein